MGTIARPLECVDSVYDFGPDSSNVGEFKMIWLKWNPTRDGTKLCNAILETGGTKYDSGLYLKDSSGTNVTFQWLQGLQDVGTNSVGRSFTQYLNGAGRYKNFFGLIDRVQLSSEINIGAAQVNNYAQHGYYDAGGPYSYYIFQKAIPIVKDVTVDPLGVDLFDGSTLKINPNSTISFDISKSRGGERKKQVQVFVKDPNGNYVPASEAVHYDVVNGAIGTMASGNFAITFKTSNEFRVITTIEGYNSWTHPFEPVYDTRTLVTSNVSTHTVNINAVVTTINIDNLITFPLIKPLISSSFEVSSMPYTTYETNMVNIEGKLDVPTGEWLELDTTTGVSSPRTLTEAQWAAELNARCNVTLSITDVQNNVAVPEFKGLGPHSVSLPQGNYKVQFKTTKK